MSEFQSAAIDNTVRELPRPQGYLWPEPPKEAKDTLPKDFGWPATRLATARLLRACSSVTSTSNSKGIEGRLRKGSPFCVLRVFYSISPSAKPRTRPQGSRTCITWSEMQPASCRFIPSSSCKTACHAKKTMPGFGRALLNAFVRDQRSTRPEPEPFIRASTSLTVTRLKSPEMVCLRQEAATANSSASAWVL